MLIRFRVSNFLSFKNEVELSMLSGSTSKHPDHIISAGNSDINLLRSAVLYGANASGKSNLVKAIEFAKDLVLSGSRPKDRIAHKPFRLDPAYLDKPTKFEFEFAQGKKCYLYGFEVTTSKFEAEWLYELKKTTEDLIFERRTNAQDCTMVEFGSKFKSKKRLDFIKDFSSGTRPNQLFISKCYEDNNIKEFNDVTQWFDRLTIIYPGSQYRDWVFQLEKQSNIPNILVQYLQQFDTGVCGFSTQKINPEGIIPEEFIHDFSEDKDTETICLSNNKGQIYLLTKEENSFDVKKVVFRHHVDGCTEEPFFDLDEESDGTLRLVDLIPILHFKNAIFIIDELDRSLHPVLSHKFIELFLSNHQETQLIATTHESNLLDLNLLRRDEIWFVEKDQKGASQLYSLEEFAPRHDKDIRKGYLLGRYGAIPVLGDIDFEAKDDA